MDDEAGGLFNIALSDSENEQKDESATEKRARRTGQSQAEYQAVKDTYRAKIEKGEVHRNVSLPLDKGARKHLIQEVLYAAEELYFFQRYGEGADFLNKVLADGSEGSEAFDAETRTLLLNYKQKCEQKMASRAS